MENFPQRSPREEKLVFTDEELLMMNMPSRYKINEQK